MNSKSTALLAIFFGISISQSGFAGPLDCTNDVVRLGSVKQFWNKTTPTKVGNQPIRMSFDAELWNASDVANIVRLSPTQTKKFREELIRTGNSLNNGQLAEIIDVPTTQVGRHLRPGASSIEGITIMDIKRESLMNGKTSAELKNVMADIGTPFVDKALKEAGIPVEAKLEESSGAADDHAVELVMKGSMDTPKEFGSLLDGFLYKEVADPETHFHMSFPDAGISESQMIAMARALEMKVVLDELLRDVNYKPGENLSPYDASAQAVPGSGAYDVDRGVVRMETYRWQRNTSKVAHDIELRQWMDLDHAKELIHFMHELAVNAENLRPDLNKNRQKRVEGIMPANLNASLGFFAALLKPRLASSEQWIVKDLKNFSDQIYQAGDLTKATRDRIRRYFEAHGLKKWIDLRLFIE